MLLVMSYVTNTIMLLIPVYNSGIPVYNSGGLAGRGEAAVGGALRF